MTITPHMLHLLHHTLGLRPDRRESFRNYYVASEGHGEITNLRALVDADMMRESKAPAFCHEDSIMFCCTEAGKAYAIENLPTEPKRTRYDEYMRADFGHCFAEWLGINRPFYDARRSAAGWEYQMRRRDRLYTWGAWGAVSGDWKPTKKEAKASYKAALHAFNARAKEAAHAS